MEVKSLSTEEKIISASFHILEKEGISGATTKKIAAKAGVSEVTLFRKFENKEKLLSAVNEHYSNILLERLNQIFEFDPKMSIEEYFNKCYYELINLKENELNILKIEMEGIISLPNEKKIFLEITEKINKKLTEFFSIKIRQNEIRDVDPEVLALNMLNITIESAIIWKIYGKKPQTPSKNYAENFLDILINGIKSDV